MQLSQVSKLALIAFACSAGCAGAQEAAANHPQAAETAVVTTPALQYLPAATPAAVWAKSPSALADAIGWNHIVKEHPPLAHAAAQARTALLGLDLFNPHAWGQAGVDPARPFGAALLSVHPKTVALFLSTKRPADFSAFITRLAKRAGKTIASTAAGDAKILSGQKNKWRIVLRGDQVFVVIGRDAAAQASAIATVTPAHSLAETARYKGAMKRLDVGAHIAGYADVSRLLRARFGAAAAMTSIRQLAFGVDLGDDAIRAKVVAPLRSGAHPVFRPAAAVPAILRATRQTPMMLAAFSVDPAALLGRIEKRIGSGKIEQAKTLAKRFLRIDIDKDVIPLLTGEVGLAWTTSTFDFTKRSVPSAFGVNVTVGVTSGARARSLLDRLLGNPLLGGSIHKGSSGWYKIPIPNFKTVYLGVAGNQLVASTDPTIGQRLGAGAGSGGSFTAKLPPSARQLLSQPKPTGVVAMHAGLIGWLITAKTRAHDADVGSTNPQVAAIGKRVRRLDQEHDALNKRVRDLARRIGTTVFVSHNQDGVVLTEGGQFFAPGSHLTDLVDSAVDLAFKMQRNSRALSSAESQLMSTARPQTETATPAPATGAGHRSLGNTPAASPHSGPH